MTGYTLCHVLSIVKNALLIYIKKLNPKSAFRKYYIDKIIFLFLIYNLFDRALNMFIFNNNFVQYFNWDIAGKSKYLSACSYKPVCKNSNWLKRPRNG